MTDIYFSAPTPLYGHEVETMQETAEEELVTETALYGQLKTPHKTSQIKYNPPSASFSDLKTSEKKQEGQNKLLSNPPLFGQSKPVILTPEQMSRQVYREAYAKTTAQQNTSKSLVQKSLPSLLRSSIDSKSSLPVVKKEAPSKIVSTSDSKPSKQASDQTQQRGAPSLLTEQKWVHEKTVDWWEKRREREGKEREQHHQNPDEQPRKQKKGALRVAKIEASTTPSSSPTFLNNKKAARPQLERPKLGIFALYYILTKIGIHSDAQSNFSNKTEIEKLDFETTHLHKKRLEEMKIALAKEQTARQWGMMTKVFSWMTSFMGIITGIALILTGVGALAGAMLIVAGAVQITSQILEISRGWEKISDLLPGDDPEKKRAIISWLQIGIGILCLILSGVSIVYGGYSHFGEAMQSTMSVFGGVISMAQGVTHIGEGISHHTHKLKMSQVRHYDLRLAQLKHTRKDLIEKVVWGVDRLQHLFEDLAKVLEFEIELFQADQLILRH